MAKKTHRKNLKPAGKCIFCGAGNLSKEHFWPEWASELLPNYPINQRVEQLLTFTKGTKLKESPKVETKPGYAWTKKIRVVCVACNNGWMSALETAVKPILTPLIVGTPHTLTLDSLQILAQWIALKVMVAEHNQPKDIVTLPVEREKFKSTLTIPTNFRIWIAKCGVGGWQTSYLRSSATMSLTPVPSPDHQFKNIHSITFGIGELLIHVLHTTVSDLQLDLNLNKHGVIIPLYPSSVPINWPPIRNLSVIEANSLSGVLNQLLQSHKVRWQPLPQPTLNAATSAV